MTATLTAPALAELLPAAAARGPRRLLPLPQRLQFSYTTRFVFGEVDRCAGDYALLAGADVVMSTSAMLQQGPPFFARLLAEMTDWMEKKGYKSVDQMRGSMSQQSVTDSSAFVRGNYIKVLESYTKTTINTRHGERLRPGPR